MIGTWGRNDMSSSDPKHEMVCRFVLHLCSEKDDSIWKQMGELSKIDYEAAVSVLVCTAESRGFPFLREDWERVIKKMIEAYPDQQNREDRTVIELLKKPMEEHSVSLKESVYEICDYEGDPDWNEEEDYQFRVKYVIEALQKRLKSDSVSLLRSCSQEQLEGKGWVPSRFGISCCTGYLWITINME